MNRYATNTMPRTKWKRVTEVRELFNVEKEADGIGALVEEKPRK